MKRQSIKEGLSRLSPQGTHIWRDELKARCMRRMKENRRQLCQRLRDSKSVWESLQSIIEEEKKVESSDMEKECDSKGNKDDFLEGGKDDEMDLMQFLEEALRQEMIRYDEEMQYEKLVKLDEESLAATVEELYVYEEDDDDMEELMNSSECRVLCPCCQSFQLIRSDCGNTVFCSCGFHLRLQDDKISMEDIQNLIVQSLEKHRLCCSEVPKFMPQVVGGIELLYLTCLSCGHFSVVV